MLKDFLKFITTENLFGLDDNILLAISGGIDSVVLSHLLKQGGYNFGLVHCNFGLRGAESDADELFVNSLANQLGVPCYCYHFDTKKHATKHKISIQMAARELRYEWFDKIRKEKKYDYIATAHHINDAIETSLFNFSKGTGLAGIRSILPKHNHLVRPLLFTNRTQIFKYAEAHNITWREDSSNSSDKYIRNMIRLNVIPHLQSINPSLESSAESTYKRLRDIERIFNNELESFKKEAIEFRDPDIYLKKKLLHREGSRTLIYECLKEFGFNFSQIDEACQSLEVIGNVYISESHVMNIDREYLIISPTPADTNDVTYHINDDDDVIMLPFGRLQINWSAQKPSQFTDNSNVAYLDMDKLQTPLIVRKWQEGDTFQPLGMTGKKKLSDFMIDGKIPLNLKERVFVMESGNEIVWVVGHRIDNRYKITSKSKNICKIELISIND